MDSVRDLSLDKTGEEEESNNLAGTIRMTLWRLKTHFWNCTACPADDSDQSGSLSRVVSRVHRPAASGNKKARRYRPPYSPITDYTTATLTGRKGEKINSMQGLLVG